jgi:hypothetical protein
MASLFSAWLESGGCRIISASEPFAKSPTNLGFVERGPERA